MRGPLRAALAVLAIGALVAGIALAPAARSQPNLILVTVDTLRADHLGFAGYPRDTSPNLDALAREGTWFPACFSQSATTGAAHASLFTSLPPKDTGVTANSQHFPTDVASIMSALHGAGYATAGFVSSVVVGRKSKLQDHFDHFDDELTTKEQNRQERYERPADQTVAAALEWIAAAPKDRPFFVWIHLIDPHGPYAAPVDPDRYVGDAYYGSIESSIPLSDADWQPGTIPHYQALGGSTDPRYYVARYDAEIRFMDAALGTLVKTLAADGLATDTLLAITADHGETLAEPGHRHYFSHGVITYDETVRIPLVIREPRGERRLDAIERTRPLSSLDLAPTLLALLRVPIPPAFQGRNLLRTPLDPAAAIVSLGGYGTDKLEQQIGTQFSVRRGPLRFIVNSKDGSEELYDVASDPGETRNLIASPPAELAALRAPIDATLGKSRMGAPEQPLSDQQKAALKALGYVE
ncbi:sulfatase [Candidatus Binatia bacterium]|nr:sulfatase [Candidatus Binatia bacterium]